jgi:hypothetical protein
VSDDVYRGSIFDAAARIEAFELGIEVEVAVFEDPR